MTYRSKHYSISNNNISVMEGDEVMEATLVIMVVGLIGLGIMAYTERGQTND